MKSICLFFQVHQPLRYRRYRFFDIGNDHYYYDDYANESFIQKIAESCYLPANHLLLQILNANKGKFKISFSITGVALEQFEIYAPEVIDSFKALAETGYVEFLAETYSHSLASLQNQDIFEEQVKLHTEKIQELFGQQPKVFKNTEMIYSDEIGAMVENMGYKGMLTEGAKHVLGWKSPNFLYVNAINPRLKVMMRNFRLSDDLAFRFGDKNWAEYPLTTKKYISWIVESGQIEEIFNIFLDYETFGGYQRYDTGIFEFLSELPKEALKTKEIKFSTPTEIVENVQPVSIVSVPYAISWADEERDLTPWMGNEMQNEAFNNLYGLKARVLKSKDEELKKDWNHLQISDHFYYMSTKFFSSREGQKYFNPYDSPYEAFINYMNVLSDFKIRLDALVPESKEQREIASLSKIIEDKNAQLLKMEKQLENLKNKSKKKERK